MSGPADTVEDAPAADLGPSKSARKREFLGYQKLADELRQLRADDLDRLPLSEALRVDLEAARTLRKGALSRQLRYLGKRIAEENPEVIRSELDRRRHAHDTNTRAFRQLEQWRDRLLAGDTGLLTELVGQFPAADVQHLRQLVRNASKERERNQPPKSARALFRYLAGLRDESAG
ncbi:MAG: ribosome biogenesis factor YjgA [Pseudomonadota bacterium]